MSVASINDSGSIASVSSFIEQRLLLPGQYLALTENTADIRKKYVNHDKKALHLISEMPTMSNDEGKIKLVSRLGKTIDSLYYLDDYHSPVISNKDGIALEKTQPDAPSNDKQYWTSAASSAGYGTPGLPNSQLNIFVTDTRKYFLLLTETITPNNDGDLDLLKIKCQLPEPGYWVTARIFNENGFQVSAPFNNYSVSADAIIQWDGNINGSTIPAGNYVIKIEAFRENGITRRGKLTFSVNR